MALSFSEKRTLQKTVATNLAALAAGNVSFTDKRRLQKEITEAMAKLNAKDIPQQSRSDWEREVTDLIITRLDVPNGDAQGIVEAQGFILAQAWGEGLNASDAADRVIAASNSKAGPKGMDDVKAVLPLLKKFIGQSQLQAVLTSMRGEEGQFFIDKMLEIADVIQGMPATYKSSRDNSALAFLHYFRGGSDWYIIEKDMEQEQEQAWGYAVLNGDTDMAETGYISIVELLGLNVELDFYWSPKTLGALRGKEQDPQPEPEPKPVNQDLLNLQAGKFDSLEPLAFLGKLKEIADQINDIEPLKVPAIAYIEKNADKVSTIMESAMHEAFGKLWNASAGA